MPLTGSDPCPNYLPPHPWTNPAANLLAQVMVGCSGGTHAWSPATHADGPVPYAVGAFAVPAALAFFFFWIVSYMESPNRFGP